jgi:hypothetical protein
MNFLDRLSKKAQISSFLKIRPMGVDLFPANGQTDMTKLIVAFRNFAIAPKKFQEERWTPKNLGIDK